MSAAVPGHAQVWDAPAFTPFGMSEGLSQGTVNVLLQDARGFLWIGTQDGLNRFDGLRFRAFKHVRDDTTSLPDDWIESLARAEGDDLWVGTERMGLSRFDPLSGEAIHYSLFELGPWNLAGDGGSAPQEGRTVRAILPLPNGSLVLSTDVGLVHFIPLANPDERARPVSVPDALSVPTIPTAACSSEGGGGLVGFSDGSIWRIGPDPELALFVRVPASVTALACPREGIGFAATARGEVLELRAHDRSAKSLVVLPSGEREPPGITALHRDREGVLWIATVAGLYLWEEDEGAQRIGAGSGGDGLPHDLVKTFLEDADGVLWIGTWNGIARVHPLARVIRRLPLRRDAPAGLSGKGVVAIAEGSDGGLWVGTMDGGVNRIAPGWRDGPFTVSEPPSLESWGEARVMGLDVGSSGELWIAAHGSSFVLFDPSDSSARAVPVIGKSGARRLDELAYSVLVDHAGVVWGGTGRYGLTRFNPASGAFEEFRGPNRDWDFGSPHVWPLAEHPDGSLWLGAFNGGVSRISPDRRSVRHFVAGSGGLSNNRVLSLFVSSTGEVWVGTEGGGINRLDPSTGQVRVYTVDDGLPHDHVLGILEDEVGLIWVSTNDGIARLDPEAERFWTLRESAGLMGSRFFANGALRASGGELLFGGEMGMTLIDPSLVSPTRIPPRVELTGLAVHGEPVPLGRAAQNGGLVLHPHETFFSFEFAALDFADPMGTRFRYMLEGLDEDWVEAGPGEAAHYTAVRPGRYTFKVTVIGEDGSERAGALDIPVRVLAPFYRNRWFLSGVGLALLLLLTWVVYGRISEHRRRFDVASRLHDGIGASIASILRSLDRVAPALAHDPSRGEELRRIATLARRAQTETRAAVRILRRGREADTVDDLVRELRDTADWMLQGHVEYEVEAPETAPPRAIDWRVRTDASHLFSEALNNVLRHSRATTVEVRVDYSPPSLHLRVADNGVGFDREADAEGNGIDLMKAHAARHGGEFVVRSRPGEGTVLEASIRLHS